MARYSKDLVLNKPEEFVTFIMNDYLQKNQFAMSEWKGEPAYRAGDAMMEGYKFLNWSYKDGTLHLEAWLKNGKKEMDLEGFVAALQKKPYKASLEQLFVTLQQDIPEGQTVDGMAQSIQVETVDNTSAATLALVFGILSVITAFIIPLLSIILAVLGFQRARMGSGSSKAGMAKAGKILCVAGVVIAIIMWVMNFMVGMGLLVL